MSRRLLAVLAAVLCAVCAACQVRVTSDVTVAGDGSVSIVASVTATDEAAEALGGEHLDRLKATLADRAGVDVSQVKVTKGDKRLVVSVPVDYEHVTAAAALTGISSMVLTGDPGSRTLTVGIVAPTKLDEAVRSSVAGQPDAGALADTLAASTRVGLTVRFSGAAADATFAPGAGQAAPAVPVRDGDAVTFTEPLAQFATGTLTATERPSGASTPVWVPIAVGVVAIGAAWVGAARIDARRRARRALGR